MENQTENNAKQVTFTQITDLLNEGLSRGEIAQRLGLTKAAITEIFKHPDLKGRRKRDMKGAFKFVDDRVAPETKAQEAPVSDFENAVAEVAETQSEADTVVTTDDVKVEENNNTATETVGEEFQEGKLSKW